MRKSLQVFQPGIMTEVIIIVQVKYKPRQAEKNQDDEDAVNEYFDVPEVELHSQELHCKLKKLRGLGLRRRKLISDWGISFSDFF